MKATIRRADGTVLELEGTAEEIARVAGVPAPVQFIPVGPSFPGWYWERWTQPGWKPFEITWTTCGSSIDSTEVVS